MSISRRVFLKSGLAAMLSGVSPGLMRLALPTAAAAEAEAGEYRAAVCVYLRGGNDGSNSFLALSSDRYSEYAAARGALALPRSAVLPVSTHTGSVPYGFHPQLPGLRDLFNRGRLAVLANVGTLCAPTTREQYLARSVPVPQQLFSHSDQMRQWQSAQANRLARNAPGWGGQMADALLDFNRAGMYPSVTTVAEMSTYCRGETTYPAAVDSSIAGTLKGFGISNPNVRRMEGMQRLLDNRSDHPLIDAAVAGSRRMMDELAFVNETLAAYPALQTAFPATELGAQLRKVAQMIQAHPTLGLNRQIFFVSLPGFDTHANQLVNHAKALAQLDAAMAAFYRATEELGMASQVLTFTLSEFGRTTLSANGGSDHGWGSHHFVMGGGVRGGEVYGAFPSLELGGVDDATDKGRLIPTTSVDQYAATITSWMGVGAGNMAGMFPNLVNFQNQRLAFV